MVSISILASVKSHPFLSSLGLTLPLALHLPLPAHLVSVSPLPASHLFKSAAFKISRCMYGEISPKST